MCDTLQCKTSENTINVETTNHSTQKIEKDIECNGFTDVSNLIKKESGPNTAKENLPGLLSGEIK